MENNPDFKEETNPTPDTQDSLEKTLLPETGPRYGAVANQETRWVYGDQEYRGGNPQAYVAEQRRLEEEKRAKEKLEAEKATEKRKKANGSSGGFFAGADFQPERQSRRTQSENYFRDTPVSTPPNSNFGPADMSGQPQGIGVRPQYGPPYNNGKLPTRTGPITMFISGLLLFLIISPLVFFGGVVTIFSGLSGREAVDGSEVQVTVEKDTFTLITAKRSDFNKEMKCEAFQGKTKLKEMGITNQDTELEQIFIYQSLKDGKLDIKCSTEDGKAPIKMVVIAGISITAFLVLFIVASVIGILGFVLIIWGIIWWVRRNRLRRMALMGF